MKCPGCQSQKTRVIDSREGSEGRSVRRRRQCESCAFRFTTFERIEDILPMIVKKGGQRESFDPYKILSGLKKACEKRPVSVMQMEDVIKSIEAKLIESGDKEVNSTVVGEMLIERLHNLDQVAYVRFASVYRDFSDVNEFMEALRSLVASGKPADMKSLKETAEAQKNAQKNKAKKEKQQELGFVKTVNT